MAAHHLLPATIFCCALLFQNCTAYARLVSSYRYLGCFQDSGSARDLGDLYGMHYLDTNYITHIDHTKSAAMTYDVCSKICAYGGWPYFGVQDALGCYCGTSYGAYGQVSETVCSSVCSGNASLKCGGYNYNSVFAQTYTYTNDFVLSSPAFITVWTYYPFTSYWNVRARSLVDCLSQCGDVTCQGVIFSQPQCYLLRYVLVPEQLIGVSGEFWVRR